MRCERFTFKKNNKLKILSTKFNPYVEFHFNNIKFRNTVAGKLDNGNNLTIDKHNEISIIVLIAQNQYNMPHILFRMEVIDGHNVEAAKEDELNHRS